ncbi:uncharacterized protein LOC131944768 [Physella acuta]|uniref:uncharacterized protein LOC131944768 n=1 Tax=Physella acuta TaxID=109671 RepID=UPI0027DD00C3|nr:uncharacterized protein LOC131944768 [Physella acuta]
MAEPISQRHAKFIQQKLALLFEERQNLLAHVDDYVNKVTDRAKSWMQKDDANKPCSFMDICSSIDSTAAFVMEHVDHFSDGSTVLTPPPGNSNTKEQALRDKTPENTHEQSLTNLIERVQAVEQVLESIKNIKADVDGIKSQIDQIKSDRRTKNAENDQTTSRSNDSALRTEMTTAISELQRQYTEVKKKTQLTTEKCGTIEGGLHECLKRLERFECSMKDLTKSVTSFGKKHEEGQQKTNSQIQDLREELEQNMEEREKKRNKRVSRLKDKVSELDVILAGQTSKLAECEVKVSTNVREMNDLRAKLEVLSKTGGAEMKSVPLTERGGVVQRRDDTETKIGILYQTISKRLFPLDNLQTTLNKCIATKAARDAEKVLLYQHVASLKAAINKNQGGYSILLVGGIRSGKSSTGNSLLGHQPFTPGGQQTEECTVACGEVKGQIIEVVDTIGMYNFRFPDEIHSTRQMMKHVFSKNPRGFHVCLFVTSYTNPYYVSDLKFIGYLKQLFGADFVRKFCVLVVTGGDQFDLEYSSNGVSFLDWVSSESCELNQIFIECNRRAVLFDNNTLSEDKKTKQNDKVWELLEQMLNYDPRFTECDMVNSLSR